LVGGVLEGFDAVPAKAITDVLTASVRTWFIALLRRWWAPASEPIQAELGSAGLMILKYT
jgi:hypothetical protein